MESIEHDPLGNFMYALKAPETRRHYIAKVKAFFDYIELVGDLKKQSVEFVKRAHDDPGWALASIMRFVSYQRERAERKEIAEGTVKNYFKPVKLFCEMNDISLGWRKISIGMPKARKAACDRAPTAEEQRRIVEYPDRRIKSIVYAMSSSGIRLGAWDYLRWGHIEPAGRDGEIIAAKLRAYADSPDEYLTFITPEAYRALKEWMDLRQKNGEKITKDSWVMRDLWEAEQAHRGLAAYPKKLASIGIKRLVERALWSQGLRRPLAEGEKRHEFKTDHGFRKFFKTRAEQVMKPINVEWLLGHSTGVSDSYYRPSENELLADYLKAVPLLQISEAAQAWQELVASEKTWHDQFAEMKSLVEKMQTQLNSLTAAVVSAKLSACQG
ncbi:MAG: hypothetical protein ACREBA_01240 [Nitrosotalea sp.]